MDKHKAAIAAAKTRMEKAVDEFRKELTQRPTGRPPTPRSGQCGG